MGIRRQVSGDEWTFRTGLGGPSAHDPLDGPAFTSAGRSSFEPAGHGADEFTRRLQSTMTLSAFAAGYRAHLAGRPIATAPDDDNDDQYRVWWVRGWLDALAEESGA